MEKARQQQEAMAERVNEIVEKARKAGTARPPGPVKTRKVDPKTLR